MKRCIGCGRIDDKPLGLNKNGEPFLACCPDSNYVEMTAVEWLAKEINKENGVLTKGFINILIQQAKEMEKQNIIITYIDGYNSDCMSHESTIVYANDYYNKKFKQD